MENDFGIHTFHPPRYPDVGAASFKAIDKEVKNFSCDEQERAVAVMIASFNGTSNSATAQQVLSSQNAIFVGDEPEHHKVIEKAIAMTLPQMPIWILGWQLSGQVRKAWIRPFRWA